MENAKQSKHTQFSGKLQQTQEKKFDLLDHTNVLSQVGKAVVPLKSGQTLALNCAKNSIRVSSNFEFKFVFSMIRAVPLNPTDSMMSPLTSSVICKSISEDIDLLGKHCYKEIKKIFDSENLACSLCRKRVTSVQGARF